MDNSPSPADDLKALEAFVIDNPDLERLETLLGQFNIFEAIGAVRQEVRHSDFLAFLLNPQQNHGLGDVFVKRFLQKVLLEVDRVELPITLIDVDVWSLDQMVVLREWQNIDILLLDELHRVAVIIENKIDSGERYNQLIKYQKTVEEHYPGWKLLCLYLTPDGSPPTNGPKYMPIDYGLIDSVMQAIIEARSSTIGADVRTLLLHYRQMLRRHIVSDSDVAELCRRIYQKHQRALDLIYEHRPDLQTSLASKLEELVKETSGLELDASSKGHIRFHPEAWNNISIPHAGGTIKLAEIMPPEFNNGPDSLIIRVIIGPGPVEIRQRLLDIARTNRSLFKTTTLKMKWNNIFSHAILKQQDYYGKDFDELVELICKRWAMFVQNELPKLTNAFVENLATV